MLYSCGLWLNNENNVAPRTTATSTDKADLFTVLPSNTNQRRLGLFPCTSSETKVNEQSTNARRINGVTTTAVIRPRRIRGKGGRIHRTRQLVGTAKDATMRPAGVLEKAKRHARWQLPRWDGRSTGRGNKTTGILRKDVTKWVTRHNIFTTSTPLEGPVVQSKSAYALISPGPPSALGPTQLLSRPAAASVGPRNPVKLVSIVMTCRKYAPLYQNQIPTKALHHRQIPTKALHHRQIPTKVRVQVRVVTESKNAWVTWNTPLL